MRVAFCLLLGSIAARAFALDPNRTIDEFFHTEWTIGEGAPSGITQIAQTTDGFLWLGTQTGLIRFDGARFERYPIENQKLPSSTVTALAATPDDGLWVGFVPHGIAFLKQGRVVAYGQSDGLPLAMVLALALGPDRAVWAGTGRGVRRFDGTRWETIGEAWGLHDVITDSLYLDRQGRFWVSNLDGLYFLPPHARHFQRYSTRPARPVESDGSLWLAEGDMILGVPRSASEHSGSVRRIQLAASRALVDRDNSLWIVTHEDGLARFSTPDSLTPGDIKPGDKAIQRFGQEQGLSDNHVIDAFEDREGNIWVATRGGLDRFRPANLVPGPFPFGSGLQDLALAADPDGGVWAGNLSQPLMRFRQNALSLIGRSRDINCAWRDVDNSLWFGEDDDLVHLVDGKFETIPLASEIDLKHPRAVQAIMRDRSGGLWVSVYQNGVFRLKDGSWTHWGNLPNLPRRTPVSLWTDPRGRTWFGYAVNEIARIQNDSVSVYSSPDGLDLGTVAAFGGTNDHIWVGGDRGLASFDGTRFHMLTTTIDGGFRGVSGIVELPNGDVWINQANGVVHIPAAEVQTSLHDFHHELRGELFDYRDGSPGSASPVRPLPSAILAADGRIWVSGTGGTAWIDPAHLVRNPLPPPVAIESVIVDDHEYAADTPARLPAQPSDIEIAYAALSLTIPERVRFRYRLEGYDKTWQDAGDRRSAFYTDLGPGRYTFRVIACNNDGVWNQTGAAIGLIVPPAWFQTWWFRTICILAGVAFLWALYLLRLGQLAIQMQGRLRERLAERERIARELHDTLLQGIQALVLRFQAAANQIRPDHPARQAMNEALDGADQVMIEGRRRVSDLRAGVEPPHAFAQALCAAGEELARDHSGVAFHLSVHGAPRELHPLVYQETYWIGREALLNAFYHANARSIRVELDYGRKQMQVRFEDDGSGIPPETLKEGGKAGHFGLRGMRERAEKIGAQLSIFSQPGSGTRVILRIPSSAAYRFKSRWSRS